MAPSIHLQNALTVIRQGYCLGANPKDSKGMVYERLTDHYF
jgi:hypothetical protein